MRPHLCVSPSKTTTALLFLSLLSSGTPTASAAVMVGAGVCTSKIGEGSNLVSDGSSFIGKCEGAGHAPRMVSHSDGYEVTFKVPKGSKAPKDRTELALRDRLPFRQTVYVGFQVQIPEDSEVTNDYFYLMQFWQGSPYPPIAGLRIDRGTARTVTVMARSSPRDKGKEVATFSFEPGKWVPLVLGLTIDPAGTGKVDVWRSGKLVAAWQGKVGYDSSYRANDWYRLKYGIYKGNEPDRSFEVKFRNLCVSTNPVDVNGMCAKPRAREFFPSRVDP